jgi:hypothetical protein
MKLRTPTARSLARLLAWDAPFLPLATAIAAEPEGLDVVLDAAGVELTRVFKWPRVERSAVALQAFATGAFLFEHGWYPSRALLRSARVVRGERGPWFRLTRLPTKRLEDAVLERRLRIALGAGDSVLVAALTPLLRALLPERGAELERAAASRPAWESAEAWVEALFGEGRGGTVLHHPAGKGRVLWARRFSLPRSGVFWVEEEDVLPALAFATQLAAAGGDVVVATGAFEETDVARLHARAAADGRDCVVLTTLCLPGVPALPLAGEADAVWVVARHGGLARAHAAAAMEAGVQRPEIARQALEAGAAHGFSETPVPSATRGRESVASASARRALAWLASAPVGLSEADLERLAGPCRDALTELERLGLAQQRGGAWRSVRPAEPPRRDKLEGMADTLPLSSAAGVVARGLTGKGIAEAVTWCEARVAEGRAGEVLAVASALAADPELSQVGAEVALSLGHLAEAESLIEGVAREQRGTRWHALSAWWAEQAGVTERAAEELAAISGELSGRLAARVELVAADLARRQGNHAAEREHIERAVAATEPALADAELALAAWSGSAALSALRRARGAGWGGDEKARVLQLLALAALDRGSCTAAATALRAALRTASGNNLRLIGEIHADLGYAGIRSEQAAVADRHLMLAESLLERCGSRRAVTVVRANRAVLACDRLDWRTCRELTVAACDLRGARDDVTTWLGEIELARAELARGDVAAVEALLPNLAEGVARHDDHPTLVQALAALRAHLSLALGDLATALSAASGTEASEQELILALGRAERGIDPPISLPQRWGVAITAQLLAVWCRGDEPSARARLASALERTPREAAVGLARFAAVLARRGQHVPPGWQEFERAAEAALASAELDGWAGIMRGACGLDPVRLVRALDGIVNAGTDALAAARLEALGRALGLRWLEVERAGVPIGSWGAEEGEAAEIGADGIRVHAPGSLPALAEATLLLVARHLATRPEDGGPEPGGRGGDMLGNSVAIEAVREQIARWGPLPLTVLVVGEPGTGKELVAREITVAAAGPGRSCPSTARGSRRNSSRRSCSGW